MKRKVKLILGITSLYNKDDFYNHFTKNFRYPNLGRSRFYLTKVFQSTTEVYYGAYIGIPDFHSKSSVVSYTKFSSYKFGFQIREAML
jgi:hypothetical protein